MTYFRWLTSSSSLLGRTITLRNSLTKAATFCTNSNHYKTTRWGIVSAGKISSDYAKAIAITEGAEVVAVAARSLNKAQSFAKEHSNDNRHTIKAYGSYQQLFQDSSVDVIYIGSIANEHYSLAKQSLAHGKATVVEKPLTLNAPNTKELIQLAQQQNNVFFMEGMWTRCFPALRQVRQWVDSGQIGRVVTVQADFGWLTKDCGTDDRIWDSDSGGMLLDIGMYMIQLGQVGFGGSSCSQPKRIQAMGSFVNGVDHTVLTNIQYKSGGFLQFNITGDANTEERVVIQGSEGRIIIEPPAHVPTMIKLQMDQGRVDASEVVVLEFPLANDSFTTWNYPGSIGFTHQIQAVGEALAKGEGECRHYTHEDSLQVATIMDEIRRQLRQQQQEEEVEQHDYDDNDGDDGDYVEMS